MRWFKKSPPLLTIEDLNEHLDGLPYDSVRKHRILLRQMFEFARSRDMIPDKTKHQNPAELILLPVKPKKKSERLSEEQFWKVYEDARKRQLKTQTQCRLSVLSLKRIGLDTLLPYSLV